MPESDSIHLAIPADGEAYRFYARVTAESARRGSSLPVRVHCVDWTVFDRARVEAFGDWHGSAITWSRLWLPELFPDLDWIVSADADVMFRGDIADLWKLRAADVWALPSRDCPLPPQPFNRAAVAWYAEHGLDFPRPEEYFCAGLALFNLKAMRAGGWAEMRDAFLKRYDPRTMPNADQCVLNYLLRDRKRLLPRGWGVFSGDANGDVDWSRSGAVHFVEDAPWRRTKPTHLESDLVVAWKRLANELGGHYSWRNWRRFLYLAFQRHPGLIAWNNRLAFHFRNTRGVRTP